MGILNKTKVYLAGNLENSKDTAAWRDRLAKELHKIGITTLDPTQKTFENQVTETEENRVDLKKYREQGQFEAIRSYMKEIIRKDLRMIDLSDFVIFNIEVDKPTYGTIHELVVCSQQRKAILILIKNKKEMPLWLMGLVNMSFVFESERHLTNYLQYVDAGEVSIDKKYWKLLVEELR